MPRYFIDTTDGDLTLHDEEGEDFADVEDAKRSAIASLPGPSDGDLPDGRHLTFSATVRGEGGSTLYVARLTFCGEWALRGRDTAQPACEAPRRRRPAWGRP